ncbi:Alpha/beta hydrolase family-domain-containing protein [Ilyonectria destructans]|nr:Alpha/beta hydrolase family-domain-containing protein [Ilyonectria destructans]
MASQFRIVEHVVNCSHTREYVGATAHGDDDLPKLAVKQYIPLNNGEPRPGDVTIIGAHANGFPKELYEPLWDDLQKRAASYGFRIRAIWAADCWNQGSSGIFNERILGNDPSWIDHSRDLMNLINQKQSEMPHPIVGIGHSMGGTQLALLSLMHPRLLRSLVLIDPVIQIRNGSIPPAILSTKRRDVWPSREDAQNKFNKSKFYQSWDPRVLDAWVRYGLRALPTELHPSDSKDGRVTLSTSKHQELFTFLRPTYRDAPNESYTDIDPDQQAQHADCLFYRSEPAYVFKRLGEIRPSVQYVFGGKSDLSPLLEREAKMVKTGAGVGGSGGAEAGLVKQVVLDCGHLVPMERTNQSAQIIAEYLGSEVERWQHERRVLQEHSAAVSRQSQIAIDERWSEEIRRVQEGDKDAQTTRGTNKSKL